MLKYLPSNTCILYIFLFIAVSSPVNAYMTSYSLSYGKTSNQTNARDKSLAPVPLDKKDRFEINTGCQINTLADGQHGILGLDGLQENIIWIYTGAELTTNGNNSHGIKLGDKNDIKIEGTITTNGNNSHGLNVGNGHKDTRDFLYVLQEYGIRIKNQLTTTGIGSRGVNMGSDNKLNLSGAITTKNNYAEAVYAGSHNTVKITGTISTGKADGSAGESSDAISVQDNNTILIAATSSITTNGEGAEAITLGEANTLDSQGAVTTTHDYATGIYALKNNTIHIDNSTLSTKGECSDGIYAADGNTVIISNENGEGKVEVTGSRSAAVWMSSTGNATYLSGNLSAAQSDSYAVKSGNYLPFAPSTTPENNTLFLLSNASVNGSIANIDADGNGRFNIISGYALTADSKADLSQTDPAADITLSGEISSESEKEINLYVAGGTTTINSRTCNLGTVILGADEFISTAVPIGGGTTASLDKIDNAAARLVLQTGAMNHIKIHDSLTIGKGSTYTINATQMMGRIADFTLNGLVNISPAGRFIGQTDRSGNILGLGGNWLIGRTGKIENNGAATILDFAKLNGSLTIDLGETKTEYGQISGSSPVVIKSRSNTSGNTAENVFAINGITGHEYANVFNTAIQTETGENFLDGAVLNTTDPLRVYKLINNGTGINVTTNAQGISERIRQSGGTVQQVSAITYLVDHQRAFDTAGRAYVQKFDNYSGADLVRAASETIGEQATTATSQVSLEGIYQASGAVRGQLAALRTGPASSALPSNYWGDGNTSAFVESIPDFKLLAYAYSAMDYSGSPEMAYGKLSCWAKSYGGFGEQDNENDFIGYSFYNTGAMLGFDYRMSNELRMGALLGFVYSRIDLNQNRGYSSDNSIRIGSYGSYSRGNFSLDFAPTAGIHFLDSTRKLMDGTETNGNRNGFDLNINGALSYHLHFPGDITLTPCFSLNYTYYRDPSYSEEDGGAANLTLDEFSSNSLIQDIEIKARRLFRLNSRITILPEIWAGWEYEYLDTGGFRNSTTSASLGSFNSMTAVNGMADNRAIWGAGVTAAINERWSVFSRYDHKIWDTGFNIGFVAGAKLCF